MHKSNQNNLTNTSSLTVYAVSTCVPGRKLRAPRGVKQLAAESGAMKVLPVTSFIES